MSLRTDAMLSAIGRGIKEKQQLQIKLNHCDETRMRSHDIQLNESQQEQKKINS